MAWNPDQYNRFKTERFAPFYDLLQLIDVSADLNVIDLGCGTGELTSKLAEILPNANVLGVDSSEEMLAQSTTFVKPQLKFEQRTIEAQLNTGQKWDLVFSNAALQWVDDHEALLSKIIASIKAGGQLIVQIPSQNENLLNKMLNTLVAEEPYCAALGSWSRTSPVLTTDTYAQIVFENGGKEINIYEKIYPLVVANSEELFNWIAGTTLIPYIEKLNGQIKEDFVAEFKKRIHEQFIKTPILYPFKRIIIAAKFE